MAIENLAASPPILALLQAARAELLAGQAPAGKRDISLPASPGDADAQPASASRPVLAPPELQMDSVATMLLEVQTILSDEQNKTSKETVLANKTKQASLHQEVMEKLKEAAEAMEKAAKLGDLGKIFGWVAMALAIVVAAALVVATAGTTGALIGSVIGLAITSVMVALQASGTMDKITDGVAKAISELLQSMGVPKEGADMAGQILAAVILAAIMIALTLGMAAGAAAGSGAALVAGQAAEIAKAVGQGAVAAGSVAQGSAQIARGATGIAGAVYGKQAEDARAEKLDIDKFLVLLKARMAEEIDRIQQLQQQMNETTSHMINMIKGSVQTTDDIIGRMGRDRVA